MDKFKKKSNDEGSKTDSVLKENNDLRREAETLSKQQRQRDKDMGAKDSRINKLLEDNARLKEQFRDMKNKEESTDKDWRREAEKLQQTASLLEKQRNELYTGFKKSLKLVDVLKKQKLHLQSAALINFSEKEFLNVMETKLAWT